MIGDRSRDALDLQLLELSAQFLEPFPIGLGFAVVDERPVVLMGRADTDRMLDRAPVLLGASVRSSMRDCRSSWRSTTSSTRRSITGSTSARAARPTIPTRRPKSSPTRSSSMSTGAMRVRRRPPGLGRGNQEADARTRDRRRPSVPVAVRAPGVCEPSARAREADHVQPGSALRRGAHDLGRLPTPREARGGPPFSSRRRAGGGGVKEHRDPGELSRQPIRPRVPRWIFRAIGGISAGRRSSSPSTIRGT